MDNVYRIKAKISKIKAEIDLLEIEVNDIENELFDEEWEEISWEDLKKYLEDNPQEDWKDNPVINNYRKRFGCQSYCDIREGEVCIGGYAQNDRFPRNEKIYIRKNKGTARYY